VFTPPHLVTVNHSAAAGTLSIRMAYYYTLSDIEDPI